MKRIVSILFALLFTLSASCQIAVINSQSSVYAGSGGTGASLNCTGATTIVIALTYYAAVSENISDSKGNTWTELTHQVSSFAGVVIYYCNNPIVSSTQTFSTTSHFCGVNVLALSGTRTASTSFDGQNGSNCVGGGTCSTSINPGSVTPSVTSCIFITSAINFNSTAPTTPSGWTSFGNYTTATAEAGGAAYLITTNTSAQNPTWTGMNASNPQSCVIANFMPPASTPPATKGGFFYNMLN